TRLLHNGKLLPRPGSQRASVRALALSLAIALIGAGSGCSVDLLDPNSLNFFKQAVATSTPGAPAPAAAASPSRVWNGRGSETAGTPVVDGHVEPKVRPRTKAAPRPHRTPRPA